MLRRIVRGSPSICNSRRIVSGRTFPRTTKVGAHVVGDCAHGTYTVGTGFLPPAPLAMSRARLPPQALVDDVAHPPDNSHVRRPALAPQPVQRAPLAPQILTQERLVH